MWLRARNHIVPLKAPSAGRPGQNAAAADRAGGAAWQQTHTVVVSCPAIVLLSPH